MAVTVAKTAANGIRSRPEQLIDGIRRFLTQLWQHMRVIGRAMFRARYHRSTMAERHRRARGATDDLKAKIQRFYDEAWSRGELGVIDELMSDHYHDHDAAANTGETGREAARRFITSFRAGIPDLKLTIDAQYRDGSTVVTRWTLTGMHGGSLMGVPASGAHISFEGISIDRFDDAGQMTEGWGTWDGIALLRRIGALPPGQP